MFITGCSSKNTNDYAENNSIETTSNEEAKIDSISISMDDENNIIYATETKKCCNKS